MRVDETKNGGAIMVVNELGKNILDQSGYQNKYYARARVL